jgi:hypothetical protein
MTKIVIFDPVIGDRPANLALTNNFAATVDPTTANDSSQGYSAGSVWINTSDGRAFLCYSAAVGAAVWTVDANSGNLGIQAAPVAATVSATLTAANLLVGIITVNQGGGAASAQQLPAASALDTALPQAVVNSSFDFSVINISTVAAESASLTTNTNLTLVGDMDILANSAATTKSAGRFRARKTAAGAWTIYRLS